MMKIVNKFKIFIDFLSNGVVKQKEINKNRDFCKDKPSRN